jgi:hypothetical protein
MARENLGETREYEGGLREHLRAATVNALVHEARTGHRPERGRREAGASYARSVDEPVWLFVSEAVPAYSLFGVCLDAENDDPPTASGQMLGLEGSGCGSLLGLYTNGAQSLVADCLYEVRPVGQHPVLVQVTGTTPTVGSPCGPALDTWGVTADRQGLVCISEPDEDGRVWVVRSPEPSSIVGEVTTPAAAYDPDTETPGVGVVKVQFLDGDDALRDALDPATGAAPWLQTFYNFTQAVPEVGDKVHVQSTLGVGLAVSASASGGSDVAMVMLVGSGGFASGDLLWPDDDGWHSGEVMTWTNGQRESGASCLLRFVDWDEVDEGEVRGECRRVYGPAVRASMSGSVAPHYVTEVGEQTFLATRDVDVAKGEWALFDLYNWDRTPADVPPQLALCLASPYVADTWAIVTRVRSGLWLASPWECES